MKRYTKSEIAMMKNLRKEGHTLKYIAALFGCNKSVVGYHTNRKTREKQKKTATAYYQNVTKPSIVAVKNHLSNLSPDPVLVQQPKNYAGPVAFVSGLAMIIVLLLVLAK